jgi:hypothetical protein
MNLQIIFAYTAFVVFGCSSDILRAEDQTTLKTEYYEAAVNGGTAINYKRWKTSRGGTVILTHEEHDKMQNGKFSQIDTIVFQDGKKLLHFITIDGKRMCSTHPESGCTVLQGDHDGDGLNDRIVITDTKGTIVGYFDMAADGKLTPISDADLKKLQTGMKDFSDGMKSLGR